MLIPWMCHALCVMTLISRISPTRKSGHQHREEPSEDDDQDVQDERMRVQSEELLDPVMKCLHSCFLKKIVSMCLCLPGEVLGLLGPNGAGKSTTVNMIIGETDLTAGQVGVLINSTDSAAPEENMVGFLGYCPQENVLWSNLTMKEHLEIYAAVKGIKKDAAIIAINRLVQALELQEHTEKQIKALAAGLTRKLCFALSLLGNPAVMLLDEPTAGMDPKGKRQVWAHLYYMSHQKRSTKCLGSIQYLKSKFGQNYLLQIKVRGAEEGELLNAHILRIFPRAARQERISTLLVYKIPMKDALPLSKAFFQLEEGMSEDIMHLSIEKHLAFKVIIVSSVFLFAKKER
uniref:ABC transporter domain-containing protein n=1 Tax=Salvator merianae TaxID=96440 RepID=A0A8D0BZG3_SALMN